LVTQSDDGFLHAGRQGYNVFTMLYGNNLEIMQRKIALYRQGRKEAGLDPATGTVTLTLHTLLLDERPRVEAAVREPFRAYIKSSLEAHLKAAAADRGEAPPGEDEKARILDYAYERYFRTGAMFGTLDDARRVVKEAKQAGVDEIACLLDFGVDYDIVRASLPSLAELVTSFSSV
jgi:natural product biosynthesis luciferase-like monooxygenase protein